MGQMMMTAEAETEFDPAYQSFPAPAEDLVIAAPAAGEGGAQNSGGSNAAFVASALFAAGIASLFAFQDGMPQHMAAAKPAVPQAGPAPAAPRLLRTGDADDAALVPMTPAETNHPAWTGGSAVMDGLEPFRFGAEEQPAGPALGSVAAEESEEAPELMVEHAPAKPRLQSLSNFLDVVERSTRDDGFQVLHLRKQVATTAAFFAAARDAAPQARAEARQAAGRPAAAQPAPHVRQFRSDTRGHEVALTPRNGLSWTAVAAPAAVSVQAANAGAIQGGGAPQAGQAAKVASRPAAVQAQPQDMRNVNTDNAPGMDEMCGKYYQCSINGKGQHVYAMQNGVKMTQLSYDQSAEYGQRNSWLYEDPNGKAFEYKCSPLVFDLGKKGVRVSDRSIRFDIDGDGKRDAVHDIASTTGVLVFDSGRTGIAGENGRGFFGNQTDLDGDGRPDGYQDGFEALDAMAHKAVREGVLSATTLKLGYLAPRDLEKLGKAYGLGMRVGSLGAKTVSLKEAGVAGIWLARGEVRRVHDFDGQGDEVLRKAGATFTRADGTSGSYEDVWFSALAQKLRAVQNPWSAPARSGGFRTAAGR